jgi:hypothetical protein
MFERGNFSNFIEFFDGDPAVYEIWVEEFPKCYKVYVIYSTDNLKFITYIYIQKNQLAKKNSLKLNMRTIKSNVNYQSCWLYLNFYYFLFCNCSLFDTSAFREFS